MALICGADMQRYGTLIMELTKQHAMGIDNYPHDLTATYALLVNYKTPMNACGQRNLNKQMTREDSIMFAQAGIVPGANGTMHANIECYECHSMGHYASDCPNTDATDITLVQHGYTMAQVACYAGLQKSWILLDPQLTISVFNNCNMLTDIGPSEHKL